MTNQSNFTIYRWKVLATASFAAILGILLTFNISNWLTSQSGFYIPSKLFNDVGLDGVVIFRQHDRDGDGYLSLDEFEPIAHILKDIEEFTQYDTEITDGDEVVNIQAFFQPLRLNTMSKFTSPDRQNGQDLANSMKGLKTWRKPAVSTKQFAARDFRALLPDDIYLLHSVGEVFDIIGAGDQHPAPISSNRYHPPLLSKDGEQLLHRLLTMFHPRPFVHTRFTPSGSVGIVRAHNAKFVDIVFRIHAEFQLNDPPLFPFWFTPAQFTGHLVISKDGTHIKEFELFVPNDKLLNVDMEWMNVPTTMGNIEVDIGYMPEMRLKSRGPSTFQILRSNKADSLVNTTGFLSDSDSQQETWTEEISLTEAKRRLEVKLYPFKQVTYYNFTEAFQEAKSLSRPVHSIILWGALDDQSC